MPPNASANLGFQAILAWSQGFLSVFNVDFALEVAELRVFADWAFERGTYRIGLSPKSGDGTLKDVGKYITLYQRQSDGSWKIARDIWNSNLPPQQMA
jgi:ketosteroid isomerase-like protein